jgi:hypothetical protein
VALIVREVNLDGEMPLLIDTFNRGFNMKLPEERFAWLYRNNPDGRSTAWFVLDDRTGDIAGCTAVFPRRIQVRGQKQPTVAWNCGDFCIMPRYRVGGAAIKLRQAARDGIDAGVRPFLYAHPNDRMLQIHLRVGHRPLGLMMRFARPVRIATGLAPLVTSFALRVARPDRLAWHRDDYEVTTRPPSGELDGLFEQMRNEVGTALVRDSRYLTWRFSEFPLQDYRFVLTRRGSRLTGYLVFSVARDQLHVKDWLGIDARAVRTLFSVAIDETIAADAGSASVTMLETHRDLALIRRLGFLRRPETSTSVIYAPKDSAWHGAVVEPAGWYMTVGDRDV